MATTNEFAPSIREELRQHTASLHRDLDQSVFVETLMSAQLDIEIYKKILARFFGFYAAVEDLMFSSIGNEWIDSSSRLKLPLLRTDLLQLNYPLDTIVQMPFDPTSFSKQEHWWGMLYVIEGSTRGARYVRQRLERSLPQLDNSHGLNFYSVYNDQNQLMWDRFLQALECYTKRDNVLASEVLAGASKSFELISAWLTHPPL